MALPLIAAALTPLATKLFENGLNILGNAVVAKGRDVIEEKLGVNIEETAKSDDGLLKLKQLEVDHEEFLLELDLKKKDQELKEIELSDKNTASARDMNTRIQESANSSDVAKNAAYYLDFIIVGATLLLAACTYFQTIPTSNKELVYMALGSLLTMCGTILNFHRGTSHSSREKDKTIKKLSEDQ